MAENSYITTKVSCEMPQKLVFSLVYTKISNGYCF